METGENKWGAYDGRKNSNGSHRGWGTEKDEATINRNQISDAFVYLIPRTAENTHSTFLHFYSGCCCWFCLLFPPQTESINFPFFPFRNDSRCIFYSGFLLFVFISSVSSHFSFFFCRRSVLLQLQISNHPSTSEHFKSHFKYCISCTLYFLLLCFNCKHFI